MNKQKQRTVNHGMQRHSNITYSFIYNMKDLMKCRNTECRMKIKESGIKKTSSSLIRAKEGYVCGRVRHVMDVPHLVFADGRLEGKSSW
jgi:hypothetical protein